MSQSVRNILRTGDICEIENFNEETFAICIDGKLYIDLPNSIIYEVPDFDEKVIRILRPLKIENALEMWRYASEGTWRGFISPPLSIDTFKIIYVKNEHIGIHLNVLEEDLSSSDHRIVSCINCTIKYVSGLKLYVLWDLLNSVIQPLIWHNYKLDYVENYIYITRVSDQKRIAEIIESKNEGEK